MTLNTIKNKLECLEMAKYKDKDMIVIIEVDGQTIYHEMETGKDIPEDVAKEIINRNKSKILVLDFRPIQNDEEYDGEYPIVTIDSNFE